MYNRLKKTYGSVGRGHALIALGNARMNETVGSHLGIKQTGVVHSGSMAPGGQLQIEPEAVQLGAVPSGQLSYQQMQRLAKSGNVDVDPSWKCPKGSVKIGTLQQVKQQHGAAPGRPPPGSSGRL